MNFYKEANIHTSDDHDYYNNEWDKGHMAPAIHFSDSVENLKATYSYVNSALQHMSLNRGAWRDLERAVRGWAMKETIFVKTRQFAKRQSQWFNKEDIELTLKMDTLKKDEIIQILCDLFKTMI